MNLYTFKNLSSKNAVWLIRLWKLWFVLYMPIFIFMTYIMIGNRLEILQITANQMAWQTAEDIRVKDLKSSSTFQLNYEKLNSRIITAKSCDCVNKDSYAVIDGLPARSPQKVSTPTVILPTGLDADLDEKYSRLSARLAEEEVVRNGLTNRFPKSRYGLSCPIFPLYNDQNMKKWSIYLSLRSDAEVACNERYLHDTALQVKSYPVDTDRFIQNKNEAIIFILLGLFFPVILFILANIIVIAIQLLYWIWGKKISQKEILEELQNSASIAIFFDYLKIYKWACFIIFISITSFLIFPNVFIMGMVKGIVSLFGIALFLWIFRYVKK